MRQTNELAVIGGLAKYYAPSTWALYDVNLTINVGESIAIGGDSGSGKSTLHAILDLLEEASHGTYKLDGVNVIDMGHRQRGDYVVKNRLCFSSISFDPTFDCTRKCYIRL